MKRITKIMTVLAASALALAACTKVEPIVGTADSDGLFLNKAATTIVKGNSETLVATITPKTEVSASWTSSDNTVASVNNEGVVTAVGAGDAEITATFNGRTVKCAVHVESPVTAITLSETEVTMEKGKTHSFTASVSPEDINVPYTVSWASSNENIFTVAVDPENPMKAEITTKRGGTANLIVKAGDADAVAHITVDVPLTGIVIVGDTATKIYKGETRQFSVAKDPEDALPDLNPVWSSSDESIFTVDQTGLVTAVKGGKATLTVKSNGFESSLELDIRVEATVVINLSTSSADYTKDDVSLHIGNVSGKAKFYGGTYGWEFYLNDYIEVSVPDGYVLTKILVNATYGAKDMPTDCGTYSRSGNVSSWTGSSSKVRFTKQDSAETDIYEVEISYKN